MTRVLARRAEHGHPAHDDESGRELHVCHHPPGHARRDVRVRHAVLRPRALLPVRHGGRRTPLPARLLQAASQHELRGERICMG